MVHPLVAAQLVIVVSQPQLSCRGIVLVISILKNISPQLAESSLH